MLPDIWIIVSIGVFMYSGHVLIDFPAVIHSYNCREERGDPESGELHLQVSRWNGGHHPSWWSEAPSGALYKAPYCPVRQECELLLLSCILSHVDLIFNLAKFYHWRMKLWQLSSLYCKKDCEKWKSCKCVIGALNVNCFEMRLSINLSRNVNLKPISHIG